MSLMRRCVEHIGISRIEHNGTFSRLAFSPDGDAIATATVRTGALKIWDTATGNLRFEPGISASSLSFSRDGRRLVAGGGYQEVAIIDMKIRLGEELQAQRKTKKLSQEKAAKLLKTSQGRVSKMEKGQASLEQLVGSVLALGGSRRRVARVIAP